MDAYIVFKNVEREIHDVQREATKFNDLYNRKLRYIDLSKVSIFNTKEIREALQNLKTQANELLRLLDSVIGKGISSHIPHKDRDSYAYGRYGQLKGDAQRVRDHLQALRNHTDVLINSAAEAKSEAVVLVAAQEAIDVTDKNDAFGLATETLGLLLVATVVIKKLVEKFRR
jgi:hypothetical protein